MRSSQSFAGNVPMNFARTTLAHDYYLYARLFRLFAACDINAIIAILKQCFFTWFAITSFLF